MKNLSTLTRLGSAQHGTLSLVQAAEHGIGRPEWRALCRDGVIVELFPDVGRLAGAADTPWATIKAASLSVGGVAMASHTSGAATWGAPCGGTDPVHLMVTDRLRRAKVDGLVLHRPTDLVELEPIVHRQITTTKPLRTLLDLGAVKPEAVGDALRYFVSSGLFAPAAAWTILKKHRRRGRSGVTALESALAGLALGAKPPDSLLEETMAALFQRFHLPPFQFHTIVEGFEVDFLVVGTNIVVETDGWTTHGLDPEQFEKDREKDALLGDAGYIVRRFSWRQVTKQAAWVAKRIEATLRRWAPESLAG